MQWKIEHMLERHKVMAISTVRPDGWPQTTMVGYVSEGLTLWFLISRHGQKFANLARDNRVSIAIGDDFDGPEHIEGLSMAAHVDEASTEPYRSMFLRRLSTTRPRWFEPETIDFRHSALMCVHPTVVSVIDFRQGFGHADLVRVSPGNMVQLEPARPADWGPSPRSTDPGG